MEIMMWEMSLQNAYKLYPNIYISNRHLMIDAILSCGLT